MRLIFSICTIFTLFSIINFAQSDLIPVSTGEKHNERGYQNSISKNINGNEIIGDYDGNFSLLYNQRMSLPNEMRGDLTVTYNANVEHRVFLEQFTAVPTELEGYSVNAPEWIIGFNGFALQTLNFEVNFYSHALNIPSQQINLIGEETSMLIPGFHYSNKLWYWSEQLPHSYQQYDYIQFLQSDGSNKVIYNEVAGQFSGLYHETGPDQIGYAIVEIYDEVEKLRNIWYKPGDGLTYYFQEEGIEFNDGRIGGYWSNEFKPKTIYLKSINNVYGDTLFINYDPIMVSRPDLLLGRKLFSSVDVSQYASFVPPGTNFSGILGSNILQLFSIDYITVGTPGGQPSNTLRAFDIFDNWEKIKTRYTLLLDYTSGSNWYSADRKKSSIYNSKIKMINLITDELGRTDRIHYLKDSRTYRYDPQSTPLFQYCVPALLIDSIFHHNNKVTVLTYENGTNDVYTYNRGTGYFDTNGFLSASKRDRRTNFMVKSKELLKKEENQLIRIEKDSYTYGSADQFTYSHQIPYYGIWTEIITEKPFGDSDDSSPSQVRVKKYFDKIYIGSRRNALHDITTTIKIRKEVVELSAAEYISTDYSYNLGNLVNGLTDWPYFDGTLWLASINQNTCKDQLVAQKTTTFNYEYSSIYSPNFQQPRYCMTSKTEIEPSGLKTQSQFKNFIPTDFLNKTRYFSLGKQELKKIFTDTEILSSDKNEFHTLGALIGRVRKTIKNSHLADNRRDITEYFYKSEGELQTIGAILQLQLPNVYKGFLDSTVHNSLVKTKLIYNIDKAVESTMYDPGGFMYIFEGGNIVDSIYIPPKYKYRYSSPIQAKVLRTDGSYVDSTFEPYIPLYSNSPVKTRIFYNSDQDTLELIQIFDEKNNLTFEVSANKFASQFDYDILGRLTRVRLPGSYPTTEESQVSQIIVQYNDDFTFTRNLAILSDGSIYENANHNANICSYSNTEPLETDNPIGGDAEEDPGEEGDEPIGGGGGGGTYIPPNKYYYIFLPEMLKTNNIEVIDFATLFLNCRHYNISEGQNLTFEVYAITQEYQSGLNTYQSIGPLVVTFQENQLMSINVSSLLSELKNSNKNLYGFKFVAEGVWTRDDDYKLFFFSQDILPTMSLSLKIRKEVPGNSSYEYVYDDLSNKVDIIKNIKFDILSPLTTNIIDQYDVRGNLIKSEVKNESGIFETKSLMTYNYLGLTSKVTDAENRNLFNKYDYFSRAKETRMVTDDVGASKIRYEYDPINHTTEYEKQTIFDESNNKTEKILDKSGKILKEIKYDNSVPFITTYSYNTLQRLAAVITPNNKTTNYFYDDLGNISKKVDPNSGTVQFKYDRFKQLRFEVQNSQLLSTDSIIFNSYDSFSRLKIRGMKDNASEFSALNPDQTYSFESDTSKLLVVNMYDKYYKSGVFTNMPDPYVSTTILKYGNHKGRLVATAFRNKLGEPWSFKVYSYDAVGRVDDFWVKYENQSWKWVKNSYDHAGNLTKQCVEGDMYYWYDYDSQSRLIEVRTSIHDNKSTAKLEAVYSYNKDNKISRLIFSDLQTTYDKINYTYDNRGRLLNISNLYNYTDGEILIKNHPRFIEGLTYYPNGNIESQYLKNTGIPNSPDLMFNYYYDELNRLRTTKNYGSNFEMYTYDPDGNFITKTRSGKPMIYTPFPGTDRLQKVDIGGVDKFYQYDNRGNVISDGLRQISSISYDRRNLPLSMTTTNGANFKYKYDDNGNRLLKHANGVKEFYLRDHTGKELAVYNLYTNRIKMANLYGNGLLGKANAIWDSVLTEVDPGNWEYVYSRTDERHYYIKDHLGNIRIVLDKVGEVVSAQDYYPFGEIISSRSHVTGASINDKYKFTEKERDTESNYDYFGARYYDSELGRWLQVDPLADKYPGWSPYNYCLNAPLDLIDPDGMDIKPSRPRAVAAAEHQVNVTMTEVSGQIGDFAGVCYWGFKTVGTFLELNPVIVAPEPMVIASGPANTVTKVTSNILKNAKIGKQGEKIISEVFEESAKSSNTTIVNQVTGRFKDGKSIRFDNLGVNQSTGKVTLINETKTGGSLLSQSQKRFFNNGESVVLTGKKSIDAGIYGQTVSKADATTTVIRIKFNKE
ncbi:MAG: RHS repeat protein [Ignavibacteriales bacterium]|nr:MAG: RHS repeat protein [Ignavibacteriales bacterium]